MSLGDAQITIVRQQIAAEPGKGSVQRQQHIMQRERLANAPTTSVRQRLPPDGGCRALVR